MKSLLVVIYHVLITPCFELGSGLSISYRNIHLIVCVVLKNGTSGAKGRGFVVDRDCD